jgi:hypothetical protein
VIVFSCGFRIGATGNVTGTIFLSLPPGLSADTTADIGYVCGCWCDVAAGGGRFAGAGIIVGTGADADRVGRFVNAGTTLGFDGTHPANWAAGDYLAVTGWYRTSA